MIVTVTPNPALDITYRVEQLVPGESHRVHDVAERAGGKGLNTAGVLTAMGRDVLAVAPVGETGLAAFGADLAARGVPHLLVPTPVPTRRSVAIVEETGAATLFNEAGLPQLDAVWADLLRSVALALAPSSGSVGVLTVSGSLPPAAPPDIVRELVRTAHGAGATVVLDVAGPQLAAALDAAPDVVKPNRAEAATTLGRTGDAAMTAETLARSLVSAGAGAAVVSDGAAGLSLATGSVGLRAWLPTALRGNATGAGDALTAALATDLDAGGVLRQRRAPGSSAEAPRPAAWAEALRHAVAWSAAAVLQPLAGTIDPTDVDRLLPTIQLQETPA